MENRKILKRSQNWLSFALIILLAVIARLLPHPANFAPIGGLALFSGGHFKKKIAIAIPLLAMFVSDLFLGFYPALPYVYVSFVVIALIGGFIKKRKMTSIVSLSLVSSLLFFLVTNCGVWLTSGMYAKSFDGLFQSYMMGLPFFRNTVASDLFYSLSFFYGYDYLNDFLLKKLFT
ncbi:hypothetical protein M1328_00945 [Patescibacteria group bacterium]|nr:hypothetical protein [Patescibacteria group bacterium]